MRRSVTKRERAIAVLGATGYTGRLICHALQKHAAPLLLAGRNAAKLEQLAAALGGAEIVVVHVEQPDSLDALAQRAQVLINCVGPFVDHGDPVVRAAIANGAHYLDTTGEQPFVKAQRVHDTWAAAQDVTVVPALAFEIALADCAAALAAEGLDAVESVQVVYVTRFHASQGTKRTALRMLECGGFAFADGAWVEEMPGQHVTTIDLPEPVGRVSAVSIPSAEVITIPRHVQAREVRVFLAVPPVAARVVSAGARAMAALARSPLSALAARLIGADGDGPNEATRRRDVFHIAVDARGTRRGKAVCQRVLLRGRDPYGLTAAIARQGALLLANGRARRRGVLPPAMAFDPRAFLDGLQSEQLSYEALPG